MKQAANKTTEYYTIQEAADRLNVSHWTIRRRIKDGLPAIKVGRLTRIPADRLAAWEKAQAVKRG